MLTDTSKTPFASVTPLPHNAVKWTDGIWADSMKMCADNIVPQLKGMFDSKDISHVIENFKICAGEAYGEHDGTVFGDGDFYKWMEAAIYTADRFDNKELMQEIDQYIELIGKAQQEDGYLSTKQIIGEMNANGVSRMGDVNDFEVYNFGHLFTTACLHKRMTGKDSLLKVAIKVADYLHILYEEAAQNSEVQTAVCPSHYMGLIEMYRTIGDEKYKQLAEQAIRLRDSVKDGTDDNQDRIALKSHEKIVGHAVRANYLYAGVADLYSENGDEEYKTMLHKVWNSLVQHKLYLIGGCGALYNGVSPYGNFFTDQKVHQAYGYEYQLPNITAYNETCASVGLVMWAYRMFAIDQKAEYLDVIEKTMLNVNLAAVSLDGNKYFYENMLRRSKKMEYELVWPLTRTEYITSYCCPPNLARIISQSQDYAYTTTPRGLYTIMYGASIANITLENGAKFQLTQTTEYPYDGHIKFELDNVESQEPCELYIRIPSWVEKGTIINPLGEKIELTKDDANTFVTIQVEKLEGAVVEVDFHMPVRLTVSHSMVEETTNQAAIEKGPIVYCIESPDASVETLDDILISPQSEFVEVPYEIMGRKMLSIETHAYCHNRDDFDRNALYQTYHYKGLKSIPIKLIPYFAWDNRGYGEMKIWLPIVYTVS